MANVMGIRYRFTPGSATADGALFKKCGIGLWRTFIPFMSDTWERDGHEVFMNVQRIVEMVDDGQLTDAPKVDVANAHDAASALEAIHARRR